MATVKLPVVELPEGSNEDKILYLTDLIQQYKKNLEYFLNNLDDDNILNIDSAIIRNLKSIDIEAQNILVTKGGDARVVFTESTISMQAWEGGEWVDKIYFDSVAGKYVFNGELESTYITVLTSLVTEVLFADQGTIAELTVDRLQTHDKIQRYLNNDQSDVHWINIQDQYIEFVTSQDCTGSYENVYSRHGEQMFWKDGTHTHVTTENTGLPVRQFEYDKELVKLSIMFESDGSNQVPMIALGAGTGISGDKDGRGFIYKDDGGLYIEYHTYGSGSTPNDGDVYRLGLSEAGIDLSEFNAITYNPSASILGIIQLWVQPDPPTLAKQNDVWVDTNDYSRYDIKELISGYTIQATDPEVLIVREYGGTITLHSAVGSVGVVKRIHNLAEYTINVEVPTGETMNGVTDGYITLFPQESLEFISDGTGWVY